MSIAGFILASILSYAAAYVLGDSDVLLNGEIIKVFAYGLLSVPLIIMAYVIAKKV